MNQTIRQLKLMRQLEPRGKALKKIKKKIDRSLISDQLYTGNRFTNKERSNQFIIGVGATAFAILIFALNSFLASEIHFTILTFQILSASNQYQKADLALNDTKSIAANNLQPQSLKEIAQSISLTNTQLSALKLKGAKGEYTAQQCHALYLEYLMLLQTLSANLSTISGNQPEIKQLQSQIAAYEDQAENRLGNYEQL